MTTDHNFSNWLKLRRNELGVTQDELSEHLDFSTSTLRKLESGERRPSSQIANLLADYFRIPDDEREAFIAFARVGTTISGASETPSDDAAPTTPWRGVYARKTNLPALLSPFIGRKREEVAARDHLLHPKTRLLTLTGTAGIGKTRLGMSVASGLVDHFEDGVFFVDLAPVADPNLVVTTIANTIGLDAGGQSIGSLLISYLRERRLLLFLDNFEQVLDAAASIVALLEASPWLKVLVTSREALHVRGERRFPVPPLGVPGLTQLPALEVLANGPSIDLFIQRAQLVTPDFGLSQENAQDVAEICVKLDGLPLAIELAAAHTRHFSPMAIKAALSNRLKLLTGGSRDLPARHRTLRSAIAWSYELLNRDEQRLFRHLGVFVGGFTSEAITVSHNSPQDSTTATLDMLTSLADKSLVRQDMDQQRSVARLESLRFAMLESVREYALEQLEKQSETSVARHNHADYYLSMAETAMRHFLGPQGPAWGSKQIEWVDTLEAELDNMRSALDWYRAQAEGVSQPASEEGYVAALASLEKGLRLVNALRRVWFGRNYAAEGLQWATTLLAMSPRPLPTGSSQLTTAYASTLTVVGRLSTHLTNMDMASIPVRPLLEEALAIFTGLNDRQNIALTLLNLGAASLAQEDYDATQSYGEECLTRYRELGDKWGAAAALQNLGIVAFRQEDLIQARSLLEESLALFREVGENFGAAANLESLGQIAYARQDYAVARTLWEESLQLDNVGSRIGTGHLHVLLGWVALREGNYDQARKFFSEGLIPAKELGLFSTIHHGLVGLAALAQLLHVPDRAGLLFSAAEAIRAYRAIHVSPAWQAEFDAEIAAARAQLQTEAWDRAWQAGAALTPADAILYALDPKQVNAPGARKRYPAPSRTWK